MGTNELMPSGKKGYIFFLKQKTCIKYQHMGGNITVYNMIHVNHIRLKRSMSKIQFRPFCVYFYITSHDRNDTIAAAVYKPLGDTLRIAPLPWEEPPDGPEEPEPEPDPPEEELPEGEEEEELFRLEPSELTRTEVLTPKARM
jgi:hypothetical protein